MVPPPEKAERVGPGDRARFGSEAASLGAKLASLAADDEDGVWEVYAGTEKLIAILKFRLEYETPGIFTKLPKATEPSTLLGEAARLLSKASGEISGGELASSVETLRTARNDLRSYLTERRNASARVRR